MLTEKSTSQSGVIERPVIDTHDFQVVDRPILETRSAASTLTDQAQLGVSTTLGPGLGCFKLVHYVRFTRAVGIG